MTSENFEIRSHLLHNLSICIELIILGSYSVPGVSLQKLTNKPILRTSYAAVRTNHIVMKNCF